MIVLADIGDHAIAGEIQQRLDKEEWAQFSGEVAPLDRVPERLTDGFTDPAIFAAGAVLEQLALLVACLRTLTDQPIISVSHGGTVTRIVQLIRVGATDVIDLDDCFDSQMRSIVGNLQLLTRARGGEGHQFFSGLTPSQRRVAALLLTDLSENEIGSKLDISYYTVHNHVKEIYRRCGVHTRLQLITAFRMSNGLATVTS